MGSLVRERLPELNINKTTLSMFSNGE